MSVYMCTLLLSCLFDLLAGVFATYPAATTSVFGGFFDQFMVTALLVTIILAINDKQNADISHAAAAALAGITIMIIGTSFNYNCGYPLNSARDFSPRLFTLIAGWGTEPFTA